jgi:hypothetical protein
MAIELESNLMSKRRHSPISPLPRNSHGLRLHVAIESDRAWNRGYYCAVAVLLREAGGVNHEVRSLYEQGGGADHADPYDIELFREHGLFRITGTSQAIEEIDVAGGL